MPQEAMARAFRAAAQADVVISIGSTLEVHPAALVPLKAKDSGAFYAIINLGPTAHDGVADLRIEADASQFLRDVVTELE